MTITIDLPPDVAERLARKATQDGQDLAGYVQGLATREVGGAADNVDAQVAALKHRSRPQTLDEVRPRVAPPPGSNGMEYVFGHWPGDESDEEIQAALDAVE